MKIYIFRNRVKVWFLKNPILSSRRRILIFEITQNSRDLVEQVIMSKNSKFQNLNYFLLDWFNINSKLFLANFKHDCIFLTCIFHVFIVYNILWNLIIPKFTKILQNFLLNILIPQKCNKITQIIVKRDYLTCLLFRSS